MIYYRDDKLVIRTMEEADGPVFVKESLGGYFPHESSAIVHGSLHFPDADYQVIMKLTERKKASSLSHPRTPELKNDETAAGKTGGNFSGLSQISGDLHEGVSYDKKD